MIGATRSMTRPPVPVSIARGLTGIAATWTLVRAWRYWIDASGPDGARLAVAATWFVGLGVLTVGLRRFLTAHAKDSPSPALSVRAEELSNSVLAWAIVVALALGLYAHALSVGLLSDDFELVARASAWRVGAVTPALFRPLPLTLWAIALTLGAGPVALHFLNVVLHGTNAFLATRVIGSWAENRWLGVAAGVVVLVSPLNVEAVVWNSGVFDITVTAGVLTTIVLMRRYERTGMVRDGVWCGVVAAATLLSKETGAVLPVLLAIDLLIRRPASRRSVPLIGAIGLGATLFAAARLLPVSGVAVPPLSRYVAQRAVFGVFGALANPWRSSLPMASGLALLSAAILVTLLLWWFWTGATSDANTAVLCALWVVVAIAPVFPFFYIQPDLQQSRYLYLPMIGWVGLLAVAAKPWLARGVSAAMGMAFAVGCGALAIATWAGIAPWRRAAEIRDTVQVAAGQIPADCGVPELRNLPDEVEGAYVFRNGGLQALRPYLPQPGSSGSSACIATWDANTGLFVVSRRVSAPGGLEP